MLITEVIVICHFSGNHDAPTDFSTFIFMNYLVLRKITAFIARDTAD